MTSHECSVTVTEVSVLTVSTRWSGQIQATETGIACILVNCSIQTNPQASYCYLILDVEEKEERIKCIACTRSMLTECFALVAAICF